MAFTQLQRAVLYTLGYSTQFGFPLTHPELHQRLIKKIPETETALFGQKVSLAQVETTVSELKNLGLMIEDLGFLTLVSQPQIGQTRLDRSQVAQTKWQEVSQLVSLASWIPWIQAIFVTGALAVDNVEPDDDVDFMIVTQARRLWLTRLLMIFIAWSKGKRRSWHGEEKRSWCFNLWLDEESLGVFRERQSLYTAYELWQAQGVFDRGHIRHQLWHQNLWVKDFLPHITGQTDKGGKVANKHPGEKGSWLKQLSDWFISGLDWIAYVLQSWYMKPHMTREQVSRSLAFFHPRDTQAWITRRWVKVLTELAEAREKGHVSS